MKLRDDERVMDVGEDSAARISRDADSCCLRPRFDRAFLSCCCLYYAPLDLMHFPPLCSQDPVKDGEQQIRKDFDELYENMQTAFRNLED
jgi:hypothetical protein